MIQIPPLRALGVEDETLERLRSELREVGRQLSISEGELQSLEGRREQARANDAAAAARAIRSGRKIPAAKNEEKIEEEITRTRRHRDALRQAVSDVEAEISEYLSEHAEDLLSRLQDAMGPVDADQRTAVAEIQAAREKRFQSQRAAQWLSRFLSAPESVASPGDTGSDRVEVVRASSENPYPSDTQIAEVLAFLRFEAGDQAGLADLRASQGSDLVSIISRDVLERNSWKKALEARRAGAT